MCNRKVKSTNVSECVECVDAHVSEFEEVVQMCDAEEEYGRKGDEHPARPTRAQQMYYARSVHQLLAKRGQQVVAQQTQAATYAGGIWGATHAGVWGRVASGGQGLDLK